MEEERLAAILGWTLSHSLVTNSEYHYPYIISFINLDMLLI